MKTSFKSLIIALILQLCVSVGVIHGEQAASRPRINVWVHGTTIRAAIPVKMNNFHPNTKLMHYSELVANRGACPRADVLYRGDQQAFALDDFYLLRWSGLLDHRERKQVSAFLYQELLGLITKIKQKTGQDPIVTIITHSHGGNIALNLAALNQQNGHKLVIDRLVLLACPVQKGTAHFVNHGTFKQIYAFYSDLDFIQVLAMQGVFKLAGRKFNVSGNKLINIKTSWRNWGLLHNDFKGLVFLAKLPEILRQIEQKTCQLDWNSQQDYFVTI